MTGFNSQESHRLDILLICRHNSCLPAEFQKVLTFALRFKMFEDKKPTFVNKYD